MPPPAPQIEHGLALRHLRAVRAHEHAVAGGVGERVDRRLLPREVRGLRHELVGLHDAELAEAAEVRLVAPDPLVVGEHRVVVRRRVLVVDVVAVHGDGVARLPRAAPPSRRAAPRRRASLPTTWYGWSWRAPHTLSRPSRARNPKVGSGSKIDVHTVLKLIDDAITATSASSGASSGSGDLVEVERLPRVLLVRRHPREHLLLVGAHHGAPERHRAAAAPRRRGREHPRRSAVRMASIGLGHAGDGSPPEALRSEGSATAPSGGPSHARFRDRLVRPHADRQALRLARLVRGHRPRRPRHRRRARRGRASPATRSTT